MVILVKLVLVMGVCMFYVKNFFLSLIIRFIYVDDLVFFKFV